MPEPFATAADRYLHGAYHPNGHCPNGVCAEPTAAAAICSVCGEAINEDRQVVTRTLRDGRLAGIRHDRCSPRDAR